MSDYRSVLSRKEEGDFRVKKVLYILTKKFLEENYEMTVHKILIPVLFPS